MEQSVADYLKFLGIPVAEQFFMKKISSHPDYPSVLSVADTMQQLGIPHVVTHFDKKTIHDLPLPVMLHINKGGGFLLPVYNEQDIKNGSGDLEHWSGVLFKAEPVSEIANNDNKKAFADEKKMKYLHSVFLLLIVALSLISLNFSYSFGQLFLWSTSIAGLITGYFLLAKDLGITYNVIESFCNAGTGSGCGKVLQSDQGKLFGFISFSDLTFGYFAAQLFIIIMLMPTFDGSAFFIALGWIGILTIPMICYSLWLQAVVIKAWCRLCLVVSGVLVVQGIYFGLTFYNGVLHPFDLNFYHLLITFLLFCTSGVSLLLLKQVIEQKNEAVQNEIIATRLKNSPEIFTSLLFRQEQVDTSYFEHDFLIGQRDAPVKLTVAVNLFCGPCKNELEDAQELINMYPEMVNISLRFLKSSDEGKTSNQLLQTWHQLETSSGKVHNGQKLIEAWYDTMDIKKFSALFSANGEISDLEVEQITNTHYNWVKMADITKTPTTYMNGYLLPDAYRIKDLFTLIPALSDIFLQMYDRDNKAIKTPTTNG